MTVRELVETGGSINGHGFNVYIFDRDKGLFEGKVTAYKASIEAIGDALLDEEVAYWDIWEDRLEIRIDTDSFVTATTRYRRGRSIMASAWRAPNGKKYGKQTRRFPGKYLFTRKELRDMVTSGIAEDMAGTFDPMEMNYEIIGIAWNDTNGYRSGILIEDTDTGELYVGNSADANVARL